MKSVVVILAIIIIGGGVWFYLNLNNNDSKIMDNLSNQEPKPTTQNNSQPIPSSDKTGSGSFKFSCSQIASAEEVSKIFSNNFAQELDIKLTSGDGIACGYRGSDFLGVSFIIGDVFPQPADSVVDISKDLFKVHGVAVENINIGTNGFYVTEDKEKSFMIGGFLVFCNIKILISGQMVFMLQKTRKPRIIKLFSLLIVRIDFL